MIFALTVSVATLFMINSKNLAAEIARVKLNSKLEEGLLFALQFIKCPQAILSTGIVMRLRTASLIIHKKDKLLFIAPPKLSGF